jgi:TolA-binding protein
MADQQQTPPATGDQQQQESAQEEPLGPPGLRALDAERNARRELERQLKEREARLAEFEDRDKTEQQKLNERAQDAERRAQEAEQRLTRLTVASEFGIPVEHVHRLQGNTPDELRADAQQLAALVAARPAGPTAGPDLGAGPRGGAPAAQPGDMNHLIREAAGRARGR